MIRLTAAFSFVLIANLASALAQPYRKRKI